MFRAGPCAIFLNFSFICNFYHIFVENIESMKNANGINRRDFIKKAGLLGGFAGLAGAGVSGLAAGSSKESYTGWGRTAYGKDQFFNRQPFFSDTPTYEQVGKPQRIPYIDDLFNRLGELRRLMMARPGSEPRWSFEMGVDALPEPLRSYYKIRPDALDEYRQAMEKAREQRENWPKYRADHLLAEAYSAAHASFLGGPGSFPPQPQGPPEESDFRGVDERYLELKSPIHGSQLIKQITHTFGASLVGICRLKEEWVTQGFMRGVGKTDFEVPKHWKYVIVVAIPHEWDSMYANPIYGNSYDAYSKLRFIVGKLEVFIKKLGYPARAQFPPTAYEIAMPPVAIDAGLGEQGRHGVLITPELGANSRLAAVITDMPLEPDSPIDVGIKKFCNKCKICAEECPSGAISFADSPETISRGYKRWSIHQEKCYKIWNSVATSHARGCRVCIAVCPYSRKRNWIHNIVRVADPRDPTGLFASGMLAMQKSFFAYPGGEAYLPPPDGSNQTYIDPPKWLNTDEWFIK